MPFASSIHPYPKPSETLSILHDINATLTPSKRLPMEVLVQINDEVHRPNTIWEDIRSAWTAVPINGPGDDSNPWFWDSFMTFGYANVELAIPLSYARLDFTTMRYHILEDPPRPHYGSAEYRASLYNMYYHMSSADLLYRLRCFFPEVPLDSTDGYKVAWCAGLRHNQTGFGLGFSEHKGGAMLLLDLSFNGDKIQAFIPERRTPEYCEMLKAFSKDSLRLLNAFIETVNTSPDGGEPEFAYFHPAAWATCGRPSNGLRYIAVPMEITRERVKQTDNRPYRSWSSAQLSATDLSPLSPFCSLLPDLKYDVKSRRIDLVNGTTPLTEVISSSLLYYRLLCKYSMQPDGNAIPSSSLGSPITSSVWQLKFNHINNHNAIILFMDDRGFFDIRANGDAVKRMDDIVSLIDSLCSDNCAHSYDGTVAGCVA